MIKPIKFTFLFLCLWGQSFTQTRQTIDSLRNQLTIAKDDTSRNNALIGLCYSYRLGNTDSSLFYGELALESAQQTDYHKGEIRVPQDIARVLLNLINNAFYAVDEKKRQLDGTYEPTVSIITRRINSPLEDGGSKIEIKVKDNGNGIPQKVLDKIFQPFFTTKPTGQGTGLGLSLSYDIIKAHHGELKVKNEEGNGATFIIEIPIT